jgi:hypothetical protein
MPLSENIDIQHPDGQEQILFPVEKSREVRLSGPHDPESRRQS